MSSYSCSAKAVIIFRFVNKTRNTTNHNFRTNSCGLLGVLLNVVLSAI